MACRYYLAEGSSPEREVTEIEFVRAERAAGFRNTLGRPDEPATAGFSGRTQDGGSEVRGRVSYTGKPACVAREGVGMTQQPEPDWEKIRAYGRGELPGSELTGEEMDLASDGLDALDWAD